jgi:hypothetical protein
MNSRLRRVSRGLAAPLLAALVFGAFAPGSADETGATDDAARTTVGIKTAGPHAPDDRNSYHYTVAPGGRIRDYIAISNFSLHEVTLRLLARDAMSTPQAAFSIQPSAETPTDVGAWIGVSNPDITLPARSQVIAPFQMRVPQDATPGDHVGALVISLLSKNPDPAAGDVVVDNRVGLRFYLRVPGALHPRLEIADLHTRWNARHLGGRGDVSVDYTVRNTGNVRLAAGQDVEIHGIRGLSHYVAASAEIEDLLPGGELAVHQVFHGVFGVGPMQAKVTLHPKRITDDGGRALPDVEASVAFNAWPWLLILVAIGLLLLVFGLGGWFLRRKRKSRPQFAEASPAPDAPREGVLVRGLLAVAFLGLVSLAGAPPATASDTPSAPVWQAKVSPRVGIANSPVSVTTTGGCPATASNVVGLVYGAGFPKEGGVAIANGDAGVRHDGPFTLPLAASMTNLMAMQDHPTTLHGVYRIVVSCIEPGSPLVSLGKFIVAIKFDKPDLWHVQAPLTTHQGTDLGTTPEPGTSEEVGGANPTGPAQPEGTSSDASDGRPSSPDAAKPPHQKSADDPSAAAAAAAGQADLAESSVRHSSPYTWPLFAAGGVVLVVVVAWFIGSRPDAA